MKVLCCHFYAPIHSFAVAKLVKIITFLFFFSLSSYQARVALYTGGQLVKELNFNAQRTNNLNWFSASKLIDSSWRDVKSESKNVFSISGLSRDNLHQLILIVTSSSTRIMVVVPKMPDGWVSLPTTANGRHVSFLAKTSSCTANCQDTPTGTNTVSLPSTMEGWGWITISRNVPSGIKRNLSWVSPPLNLSLLRLQLTKLKQFLAVEKRIIDGQAKIWNFS